MIQGDKTVSVNAGENIPDELKQFEHWILWRKESKQDGKRITKVPYSPAGVKVGAPKARWSYDKIISVYRAEGYSGIGFSFKEEDQFIGIDYDHILDAEGSIISPEIEDEIKELNSYTEVTPSGEGLHVIVKGERKKGWKTGTNKKEGEIYFSGRFFTVTGNRYQDYPNKVREIQKDLLSKIYYRLNPEDLEEKPKPSALFSKVNDLSDSDIISKLMKRPNSCELFLGNGLSYKSLSEADSALCCHIAYYTRNPGQIYDIFCQSGLYRKEKWTDRQDYPANTISNALNVVNDQFDPDYSASAKSIGSKIIDGMTFGNHKKPAELPLKSKPDDIDHSNTDLTVPEKLLTVPGILGKVVDYYEATAPKSQPQFAVQTALALGAVAMGRRWVTDNQNYTSMFFINVGLSSAGKEHARTVINKLLIESDCGELIGPSQYASGSAVYSEVRDNPNHIAVIDEFGRMLDSTKKASNSYGSDALTVLMQLSGLTAGVAKIPAFSTLALSTKQKEERGVKTIMNPSITILAMTTPSTFYNAITVDNVTSGFIPRFIIVESEIGRMPTRKCASIKPDQDILDWIYMCATTPGGDGNLECDLGPSNPPTPTIIPIEDPAWELFDDFDETLIKKQNGLDIFNISEALGRTREFAMRLSLIVAVSDGSFTVKKKHAQWAIDYTSYYAYQTVDKIKSRVADSDFEAICKQVINQIRKGKDKGATMKGIARECPLYRKSDDRVRAGVITVIGSDYDLVRTLGSYKGKGGASAERLILAEFFNKDDWS